MFKEHQDKYDQKVEISLTSIARNLDEQSFQEADSIYQPQANKDSTDRQQGPNDTVDDIRMQFKTNFAKKFKIPVNQPIVQEKAGFWSRISKGATTNRCKSAAKPKDTNFMSAVLSFQRKNSKINSKQSETFTKIANNIINQHHGK